MSRKPVPRIGIVGGELAPRFNEAYANQIAVLARELNAPVLSGSDIGFVPFRRMGRYFIVNLRFLLRGTFFLSVINGALFYMVVKLYERRLERIILAAGMESQFLRYLALHKCIPIVNSIAFTEDSRMKERVRRIAPELGGIIVQSQRVRSLLLDMGVSPDKIHVIYPWVDLSKFVSSPPPDLGAFRILFASAPNVEKAGEDNFEAKGVPLLLESFREFSREHPGAILCLLWRGKYNERLHTMIKELGLEARMEVIDEVVDARQWFARCHITVIPFASIWRSPEIPLSAVESLACGRPVVTTDVLELADIVKKLDCGCVAKPAKEDLLSAFKECHGNYSRYQANCRRVAEELFGAAALAKVLEFVGG